MALLYDSIGAICKIYSLGGRVMAWSAALTKLDDDTPNNMHILCCAYVGMGSSCPIDIIVNYNLDRN